MPQINDNIGNALANIGQIRQQRTQNALADRQLALTEGAQRRQQQQFDTEQANAQRAQLIDTTKNVLGALSRVPQAQRQAAFAQLSGDLPPEFAQRMAGNPEAFTDQNIALALNRFGSLTPDQIFADTRREAQAKAKPESVVTYGPDGRPMVRMIDTYSEEAGRGIVQAPDANAGLSAATSRDNARLAAATSRENARLSASTSRGNAELAARTSTANARSRTGAGGLTAAQRANVQTKLQAVSLVRAQLERAQAAFDAIKGSAFQAGPGTQFNPFASGGQSFDAVSNGLKQTIRSLTRTPGEGAMSDYESRLAGAIIPERGDLEGTTAARLQELKNIVDDIEAGYRNMSTTGAGATPQGGGDDVDALMQQYLNPPQ